MGAHHLSTSFDHSEPCLAKARNREGVPIMSTSIQYDRESLDDDVVGTAVALVTGGGRGIGRLVAGALADRGVAVRLIARPSTELRDTVRAIEAGGGNAG